MLWEAEVGLVVEIVLGFEAVVGDIALCWAEACDSWEVGLVDVWLEIVEEVCVEGLFVELVWFIGVASITLGLLVVLVETVDCPT